MSLAHQIKPAGDEPGDGLALDLIRIDGGTQSRADLNAQVVTDYAAAISEGASFPPIVVFYDGKKHWLADGFHRFHAYQKAGRTKVAADVRQGTRRDAILFSVGANANHGLRRTNDDKRRAVLTLLGDAEWTKWTDREVAAACRVDHKTVGKVRSEVTGEIPSERSYTTKHGTTATMKTAGINASRKNAPKALESDEPSPEAGPQAEASPAGTGTGMPADREGRIDGEAASVDLPTISESDLIERVWKHGYLIGFGSSREGWNGEYPFADGDVALDSDVRWSENRDRAFLANREAFAAYLRLSGVIESEPSAPPPAGDREPEPSTSSPEVRAPIRGSGIPAPADGQGSIQTEDARRPDPGSEGAEHFRQSSGAVTTPKPAKPFRPHCLHPGTDRCAGVGLKHCYACRKAAGLTEAAA